MVRTALVAFLRVVVRVFFAHVAVVGRANLPRKGGVILVGNHPNSLIDPVLIVTTVGRPLRFAAKDTLFRAPLLGPLIRAGGGVPIRRRVDHGDGADNADAFAAAHAVLAEGGTFGIFPEGISHRGPELAPLKTGAARMALGAKAAGVEVHVVPVGLTYFDRDRMRSRVVVWYGAPVPVPDELVEAAKVDERVAAKALTESIDDGMRSVTLNAPDVETVEALGGLRSLLADADQTTRPAERARLHRLVIEAWEQRRDDPAMQRLLADVRHYLSVLDLFEIPDDLLRGSLSRRRATWAVARHAVLLFVLAPLSLAGLLVHAPIVAAAAFAGRKLAPRDDVVATTKMAIATLLTVLVYAVVAGTILWGTPFPINLAWAAWGLVFLATSGWAAVRVAERQAVLRHGFRAMRRLLRYQGQFEFLQEERRLLRQRFFELVEG